MKLADYVIEFFADRGVRDVFVVYGAAIGDLVDAFTKTDRIRYLCVMHEQAGAFAAEVVTKISGRLGVTLVTSGPGGTNLVTGIANCWYDSIPNVFLTGQVHSQFMRSDPSIRQLGFQENDIVSIVKPITKYAVMVTDPARIRYELERAVWEATHGRPGPVLIDMPLDLQKVDVDPAALDGFTPPIEAPGAVPVADAIERYLDALSRAERPVLLIGGGVRLADAVEEVRALGETLGIPCLPTWNALDVFTSDYALYRGRVGTYGGPGRNFAIQNADLLLTIGCRISGRITGGVPETFARAATKFFVDVDDANLDPKLQQVRGDVNVKCDAKAFAQALLARARVRGVKRFDAWLERTREWRDRYDPVRPEFRDTTGIVHPYVFMDELSRQLTARDVIVADCGGNVVVTNQAFRTKYGQRLISSNGNSPMGFSFAGAIGACVVAEPGQRVVCIIGDGGFNMNVQELQTLVTYELPLKTFIMNNHVYGITKAYQDTNFGGRYEAAGPKGYRPPDFVKLTEGYGVATETIADHRDLAAKIARVLAHPGPIVCDVNMHEHIRYEPRIFGWNTPIEDMYPYLPREEFRANMAIEPMPGWEKPAMPGGARTGAPPAQP